MPRTSLPRPGSRSPATWDPSPGTATASAAGPRPSPATGPWTTCGPGAAGAVADLPFEYLAELAGGEDTAGAALAAVGTSDALALISRLPRDQAEAVLLRVVMELDANSAAQVLGKRSGSVRMAAHRG